MPFELLGYILIEYLKAIAVSLRKMIVTFSMPFNELVGADCPAPWQTVGQSVPNYFLTEFHNLVIFHFSFVSIQLLLYNCGFAFLYSFFVFSDSEKKLRFLTWTFFTKPDIRTAVAPLKRSSVGHSDSEEILETETKRRRFIEKISSVFLVFFRDLDVENDEVGIRT